MKLQDGSMSGKQFLLKRAAFPCGGKVATRSAIAGTGGKLLSKKAAL
jgi:hypothetical protein